MARKISHRKESSIVILEEDSQEVTIATDGDVYVDISDQRTGIQRCYRCSRNILRGNSEYFDVLLDPVKFGEGRGAEAKIEALLQQYRDIGSIPSSKLPHVNISVVGNLPKDCTLTSMVVRLFLKIVHDPATPWPLARSQSLETVALLAIVADRLASTRVVGYYLRGQKLDIALLKERRAATAHQLELDHRQRLLAGFTFKFPSWVKLSSTALTVDGPKRQTTTSLESSDEETLEDNALWWRLPNGVEEELICRRDYILNTLSSIQKHFSNLYIRKPQCRLGYGSSLACDSYQLGEMMKFFARKGIVTMQSTLDPAPEDLEPYTGNLKDILARLRECPSYQIDNNHTHCGLRARLMPIVDELDLDLDQAGICLACWEMNRMQESWLENPDHGHWIFSKQTMGKGCEGHRKAKSIFTAQERDWTPPYAG